jgi:thiol-disulfide isomerase/thioredoxin
MTRLPRSFLPSALLALVAAASLALAQTSSTSRAAAPADTSVHRPPAAAAPAAPAAPPSPVSGMRGKIAAGDLLSAEAILEDHRTKHGENSQFLNGLAWLARGALLLGEHDKARSHAADVRARCERKLAAGDTLERDRDFETALGASIEVQAQLIAREKGAGAAAEYVRSEIPKITGPVSLRSRLYKRLNMLSLVGEKAPALAVEDGMGGPPPALTGQPTLLFLWAEWCGDCRAQAASLAKAKQRYAKDGLRVVAVTRYYDPQEDHTREKARVDSVWKADYAALADVPIVISTASMERYGASSTPTFVFVDRGGVVRRYTPTRLTEAEFDRTLSTLVK